MWQLQLRIFHNFIEFLDLVQKQEKSENLAPITDLRLKIFHPVDRGYLPLFGQFAILFTRSHACHVHVCRVLEQLTKLVAAFAAVKEVVKT
jgi:hypothetical protein